MLEIPQDVPEKSEVLGLVVNGESRAYPAEILRERPVLNDNLGGRGLVVITPGDGAGARAFQRDGQEFLMVYLTGNGAADVVVEDQEGEEWRMEEDALVKVSDPAERLDRLPSHVAYWFGWYGFHNDTGVYGQN